MTTYTCLHCKAPATVVAGAVLRTCACNAPIAANLKAVATGAGGVK